MKTRIAHTAFLVLLAAVAKMDPEFVARFRREARLAARMDHPGIVKVVDVGEADGLNFMVMEYVKGKTLEKIMDREKALEVEKLWILSPKFHTEWLMLIKIRSSTGI